MRIRNKNKVVLCESQEEFNYVKTHLGHIVCSSHFRFPYVALWEDDSGSQEWINNHPEYKIYSFDEWRRLNNLDSIKIEKQMKKLMLDVLNKTYDSKYLRQHTVPLFMSSPGAGKTTIIKEFIKSKGVSMIKITLSQRMPNEVVGMMMPNSSTGKLEVFDSLELSSLKDGDVLFFDEVFNGTLKQTLDACLNLIEDRTLPSGKKLANVMIVAASNPQGLINLTPQIKERFIRYDLKSDILEFKEYFKEKYGMPEHISRNLFNLINREKFEIEDWNYNTPRSIEKAINQIGCELKSPYDDILIPFLSEKIKCPIDVESMNLKKDNEIEYLNILKMLVKEENK